MKLLLSALIAAIAAGSAFAQNWTQTSAPITNWNSVASSSDGNKLVAVVNGGGIYTSGDSGDSWNLTGAPSNNWAGVACSVDGNKIVAVIGGGGIWTSADFGGSWTQTSATNGSWSSVAASVNASNLVATIYNGLIYTSTNFGANWATTADAAAPYINTAYSTNGSKWAAVTEPNFVALSADGSIEALANYGVGSSDGYIWCNLTPSSWYRTAAPKDLWGPIACSADGTRFVAVSGYSPQNTSRQIYISAKISTNNVFTAPWLTIGTPIEPWQDIALSADGTRLVLVAQSGGIYMWKPVLPVIANQPQSQTSLVGSNVTISVDALCIPPFSYQWRHNGSDLPGATNAALTLTNLAAADAGNYAVLVTGAAGGVLSSNGVLTLLPALITTVSPTPSLYGAILAGSVTPGLINTRVWFEWGTDTNYGNTTSKMDVDESLNASNFNSLITGLTPYTVYHYQALASNVLGIALGGDVSFTTVPLFAQSGATNINWNGIACSADGTKIVAESSGVGIWISTNSGATWMQTDAPNTNWVCVVSSADGTKLAAPAGSTIYTSTNSGATWTPNNTPTSFSFVASSADGDQLVGLGGGHVYTSTNAGATWTQTSAPSSIYGSSLDWTSAASTADGTKLTASAFYIYRGNDMPTIYISTNSGGSWNSVFSRVYEDLSYIAASADGNKIFATGWWGHIYSSTDSGVTWVWSYGPVDQLGPIVSSADGTKLIVISSRSEALYTSVDSGVTWVQASTPPYVNWNCIASSADGNELIAGGNGGIYISKSTTPPALNIAASNKLTLSWLMPSANFVLQQNSDLITANWTDVTNTPILNLTNLQNQVFLPMSVSNDFYRLATP